MRRAWWITRSVVGGAVACAVTSFACGWAVVSALRVEPPPTPVMDSGPAARGGALAAAPRAADQPDFRRTVDGDPFRADRQRPPRRFVAPGTVTPVARPAAPAVALTLTGTVVYPDGGGFALVRAPGRPAAMVRVGENVEGYTLRSVARDEATFARPGGGSMVLRVPKAGG